MPNPGLLLYNVAMGRHTICIMNDSFPPQLDGVASASQNYAENIEKYHGHAVVVTPEYPGKQDELYPYPIIRYPSLDARWFIGYMAGIPFSPAVTKRLKEEEVELLHCHCPAAALFLARELRVPLHVPVIMTYHTKYDIDLLKAFRMKLLSRQAVRVMMANINSCDEVWTVSRGAGDNLRSLGFKGDYVIMENGVDMPLGRSSDEEIAAALSSCDIPQGVPVFLFVGRMFWYKGIRLILDAARGLKSVGLDYRIVMIGQGEDMEEIVDYAREIGVGDRVIFMGPVYDRGELKAWYTRADVFVFPSSYDTNGLVVREAASSYTPSILIRGSCAAEGITDGETGFLIDEDATSLALMMYRLATDRELARRVGEAAGERIYISWRESVARAVERYEIVLDNYRAGRYPRRRRLSDAFMRSQGELMNALSHIPRSDSE